MKIPLIFSIALLPFCFYWPVTEPKTTPTLQTIDSIPTFLKGDFIDDYGIRYTIDDSLWFQLPGARYHIIKWNPVEQYLVARNDDRNPAESGLFSRIDYMRFENMEPFIWGFCLTVYNAKSSFEADTSRSANRLNPRKGCNGFPFSRMKRAM